MKTFKYIPKKVDKLITDEIKRLKNIKGISSISYNGVYIEENKEYCYCVFRVKISFCTFLDDYKKVVSLIMSSQKINRYEILTFNNYVGRRINIVGAKVYVEDGIFIKCVKNYLRE